MGLEPQNVNKKQTLTSKCKQTMNGNWVTLSIHAERKEAQPERKETQPQGPWTLDT